MYVNGTAITTRFIEHTTQLSFLFYDLNTMTDALQFVVYCNCKHQAQKINTDCSPTAGSYESLYFLQNFV
jgi:hypothetical protein